MRPHTAAEAAAVVDAVEDWQDVVPPRARPPPGVRRRRVLPAGRPAVPDGRGLRGLPDARGRHRHGPHLRARVHRARPTTPTGAAVRASSPGSTARPAEGYRAHRGAARDAVGRRGRRCRPAAAARRSAILTGELRRRGARRRCSTRLGRDDVRVIPVDNEFFGGNTASPACWSARTSPGCSPPSPRATATCCPTSACRRAASSTAPRPADLPRAGRGRRHRRRRAARAALGADAEPLPDRGHRRPAQRRQVDAAQPHRRPPRGDRRGAARRHPRPQGGRGRVARAPRSRWSTPAAGCPAATTLDDKVSRQAERAMARRRRRPVRGRRHRRRHRGGRPGRRRCCAGSSRPVLRRRQQGRRRRAARPTHLGVRGARPRRPVAGQRPARPGHRRPARRRSSTVLPDAEAPTTSTSRATTPSDDDRVVRGGHRRPAQRRQVDAVQPAHRRGPRGRARHAGHHPRHDRHGGRDRRRARSASSTPPACAASRKIDEGTEYYSLVRALQAVDQADVALLVIDATEGVTHQDQRLAERVDAAGCPVVVAAQQVGAARRRAARRRRLTRSADRLHFLGDAPVLKISALTGKGVHKLLPALGRGRSRPTTGGCPTREVNQVIQAAQAAQPAPHGGRVLYATQGATDPPTFTLFANRDAAAAPTCATSSASSASTSSFGATPLKLRVRRAVRRERSLRPVGLVIVPSTLDHGPADPGRRGRRLLRGRRRVGPLGPLPAAGVERRVERRVGADADATVAGPVGRSARSCTPPSLYARRWPSPLGRRPCSDRAGGRPARSAARARPGRAVARATGRDFLARGPR